MQGPIATIYTHTVEETIDLLAMKVAKMLTDAIPFDPIGLRNKQHEQVRFFEQQQKGLKYYIVCIATGLTDAVEAQKRLQSFNANEFTDDVTKKIEELEQNVEKIQQRALSALTKEFAGDSIQKEMKISDAVVSCLYKIAVDLYNNHDYQKAKNIFLVVVLLSPGYFDAWIALGHCITLAEEFEKALSAYIMAQKCDMNNPLGFLYAAYCHDKLKQPDKFQECIAQARANIDKNNDFSYLKEKIENL